VAYEVRLEELQPQPVVAIRTKVPDGDIGGLVGQLIGEVWGYLEAKGVHPSGGPYARSIYVPGTPIEVGFFVDEPLDGNGRAVSDELPGGRAIVTTHIGPYDQVKGAYDALNAYAAEQGLQPAGLPWEVYLTDPGREPDQSKWRTDVVLPIR